MKYFTKILPEEGEIKEGYLTINGVKGKFLREEFIFGEVGKRIVFQLPDGSVHNRSVTGSRRVINKLFLCSRDIRKGDIASVIYEDKLVTGKVDWIDKESAMLRPEDGSHMLVESEDYEDLFKLIGEISPKAIWIKEGDELKKDEFNIKPYGINCIIIKCPCCGDFK